MSSMLSALSQRLVNPRRSPLARLHMHAVSARLRKYGSQPIDLGSAGSEGPGFDLKKHLLSFAQALQTPFKGYFSDMLALVKRERAEREALGALPLYQRTIP